MSTPISKELSEQIEREAKAYEYESQRAVPADEYVRIVTSYAARIEELELWKREADSLLSLLLDYGQSKEANIPLGASITAVILQRAKRFEEAKKALEKIQALPWELNGSWADGIATKALASWKEEGKEDGQ